MDTALVIITLLSVGLTGALLVYATRLQREQREREDARVVALAREIQGPENVSDRPTPIFVDERPLQRPWARRDIDIPEPSSPMRDTSVSEPLAAVPATSSMLFAADAEASPGRGMIAPLVGVAVISAVLGGVYLLNARPAAPVKTTATAQPVAPAALELVSLDQARTGQTLTVRGVVRNPAGASAQRGLAAVVFVFDKSGAFVTSGRAALDYQVLAPGDESPFTVTVPNAAGVARYRVSFRNDRDVVSHVDKRHK